MTSIAVQRFSSVTAWAACSSRRFVTHPLSVSCDVDGPQALITSESFEERPEFLHELVPLLIFMGAPHGGLETKALETLVKGQPTQPLIEELRKGSPVLKAMATKFARIANRIKILSVFETLPTKTAILVQSSYRRLQFTSRDSHIADAYQVNGVWKREGPEVMMVKEEDANTYLVNETRISSHTDHSQIAKLSHSEDSVYGSVREHIAACLPR